MAPRRPRIALKNGTIMATDADMRKTIERSTSFERLKLIGACLKKGIVIVCTWLMKLTSGHCAATRLSMAAKIGCA
jgi:hypothetical protein